VQFICIDFYIKLSYIIQSRDSVVRITAGYVLTDRRIRVPSPGKVKNFLSSTSSIHVPALGSTRPRIQCVPAAFSPAIKRSGREADHSSQTSAGVKKTWVYTSILPYAFTRVFN
jgi:hypothetical protein